MAFTKIVGAGIHTLSNVNTHNINSSGIITATKFVGPFDGSSGDFSGNVSIGGSLTVNGDFTTLNTTLREIELLRVDADSSAIAGIITQSGSGYGLYVDGTTILGNTQLLPSLGAGTKAVVADLSGNGNWVDFTIFGGRSGRSILNFGDHDDQDVGAIKYYHSDNSLNFFTSTNQRLGITSTGITSITGADDQDNFIVDVVGTQFAIHSDASDGELSLRAQDGSGSNNSKYMTFFTQASGSAAGERLRIAEGGNIGIGTTNPQTKLHIVSNNPVIRLTDGNQAADNKNWNIGAGVTNTLRIQALNDANSGGGSLFDFYRSGNNVEEFRGVKSANTWFVINNEDQKVGVGLTNPSTPLHVYHATTNGVAVFQSGDAYCNIILQDSNSNTLSKPQFGVQGNDFRFVSYDGSSATEKLRIKHDGKVGIGSDDPQAKLDVHGVGIITGGIITNVSPAITIRDGTTEKGYIGFNANDPFIGRKNGVGLLFQDNKVRPVDGDDGSGTNNTVSLGEPTYKFKDLYLEGDIHIDSNVGQLRIGADEDLKINHDGSNAYFMNETGSTLHRAEDHIFENADGSTEHVRITGIGSVGIGTNNPTYKLHVDSGDAAIGLWKSRRSSGSYIEYAVGANGAALGYIGAGGQIISSAGADSGDFAIRSQGDLLFASGGTEERVRIDNNGKVCIAHTNALHSGNLQVSTAGGDAIDINSYSTNANNGGRLTFYRSKNASIGSNTIVVDDDSLGRIDFRGYNSNGDAYDQGATIEARVDGLVDSTTDMPTAIIFKTSNGGSASPDERLRIESGGNVGIGTDNPDEKLHVVGNARIDGDSASTASLDVDNHGNLGNSAEDEQLLLNLHGNVLNDAKLMFTNTRFGNGNTWETATSRIQRIIDVTKMGYIDFGTGSGSHGRNIEFGNGSGEIFMHLESNGNKVGIGTTLPTEKLDVRGKLVVSDKIATNRPRIVLSAPNENTDYKHLFGANLQVDANGTYTTPVSNISGGGLEYLPANSINQYGSLRYISAPDTNATTTDSGNYVLQERLRIDPFGRILIGRTANNDETGTNPIVQIQSTSTNNYGRIEISYAGGNSLGPGVYFTKARGNTADSVTSVANGDQCGALFFLAADGENRTNRAASIQAFVEAVGINSTPGHLRFATTAANSNSTTERLRIASTGNVGINSTNPNSKLTVAAGSATAQIEIQRTNGSGSGTIGVLNFTQVYGYSAANISAIGQGDNDGAHLVFRTTNLAAEHSPFGGHTYERLRITNVGRVYIGGQAGRSPGGITPNLQIEGDDVGTSSMSLTRNSDNNGGANIVLSKTRGSDANNGGSALNADIPVKGNDTLGIIKFSGNDGVDSDTSAAWVLAKVDDSSSQTMTENKMPGRLEFHTRSDTNNGVEGTIQERLRITSDGVVQLNAANNTRIRGGVYAKYTGASGDTANINTESANKISWLQTNTEVFENGGFTNTATDVTVPFDGIYKVIFNGYLQGTGTGVTNQRTNQIFRFRINGTDQNHDISMNNYIRAHSGHDDSSVNLTAYLNLSAGDAVSVSSQRMAQTGDVTMLKDHSSLTFHLVA